MMQPEPLGIIVNGATGGISSRQHLDNALVAIRREGGLEIHGRKYMPELFLVGRNPAKLEAIATHLGTANWTTDLSMALADPRFTIFFDGAFTEQRAASLAMAIEAGKHVYAEKPVVTDLPVGRSLLEKAQSAGIKHGVVQDKLFLPGLTKLRLACDMGAIGRVLSFRLDFGYWIFSGMEVPAQRSSWNYRRAEGGGLVLDMYPHWRYVIEGLLGPIRRVVSAAWTAVPERVDERGCRYDVDVEDSAATLVELESGAYGVITSSWATRVRRDDLMTLQVDGTAGSAVAGLHRCRLQSMAQTPRTRWDVNVDHDCDYRVQWIEAPELTPFKNSYRAGWEAFLRHVVADAPFASDLSAGIRDVELAAACYQSAAEGRWVALGRADEASGGLEADGAGSPPEREDRR
jgi:predicted dehydrogenase